MTRRLSVLLAATALAALMPLATPVHATVAVPAADATARADAALMALFERQDQALLARSPLTKTQRGIRDADYGRWNDPSDAAADAAMAEELAFLEEMRREFAGAPLSDSARLSYRLFEARVERQAAAHRFRHLELPFNQMGGAHSALPAFLIGQHRVDTLAHAEAYLDRLRGLGPQIDTLVDVAGARAQAGNGGPAWMYPLVVDAARNVIRGAPFENGADSALLADFRAKVGRLEVGEREKARLVREAEVALRDSVQPAYQRLIAAMEAQAKLARPTDGITGLKEGREWYAERLRFHTTTDMTAAEVHALGLSEVARIHLEMEALMPRLGVQGSVQDLLAHVRTSDEFYLPNTEEGREEYLRRARASIAAMEKRLPEAFRTLPRAPMEVRRVEPFRERTAGKAFYQSPAEDGSRPGVYYANLYDMRGMPIYEIDALAFHEGLPGHHMQRAIQMELEGLPAFRRFGGFTAYSEGWALYTELLPKEMGFYEDPWQDFGRLKMALWRAVRLVVDTGLHDLGWNREQAIQYHLDNTPSDRVEIERAVNRYAVMPGQATAYTIGKLEILRLREDARKALGDRFDIRDFHDAVLRAGDIPLNILGEQVHGWVSLAQAETRQARVSVESIQYPKGPVD
ncbi:MAG: DUF885 domain-containing protein [Thermaurantiacus sp.]